MIGPLRSVPSPCGEGRRAAKRQAGVRVDLRFTAPPPDFAPLKPGDETKGRRYGRPEILRSDAFVARPDPARAVVLVFGPDAGLVSERVDAIMRASVDDPDDPFSLVRLDGDALASDPARLIDEATTVPLFGGRRAIRVRAGSRNIVPAVEAVLAAPLRDCRVVIEAGDLKRNAPLRSARASARRMQPRFPATPTAIATSRG